MNIDGTQKGGVAAYSEADVAGKKRRDLASSVGAGLVGLGLGTWLAAQLSGIWFALLLIGVALHGWAMFAKHRAERWAAEQLPAWATAFYWICWVSLGVLLGYFLLRTGK